MPATLKEILISNPTSLANNNEKLYFAGQDLTTGKEPRLLISSKENAELLGDLVEGIKGSSPHSFKTNTFENGESTTYFLSKSDTNGIRLNKINESGKVIVVEDFNSVKVPHGTTYDIKLAEEGVGAGRSWGSIHVSPDSSNHIAVRLRGFIDKSGHNNYSYDQIWLINENDDKSLAHQRFSGNSSQVWGSSNVLITKNGLSFEAPNDGGNGIDIVANGSHVATRGVHRGYSEVTAVGELIAYQIQGIDDARLYISDGTEPGTNELLTSKSAIRNLTEHNGRLAFSIDKKLWISNGTEEGTTQRLELVNAPKEKIWQVLLNTEEYEQWNNVINSVEGILKEGERVKFMFHQEEGKSYPISAKVRKVETNSLLNQFGGYTGIITYNHTYTLNESDTNTKVIIHEEYNGLMVPF